MLLPLFCVLLWLTTTLAHPPRAPGTLQDIYQRSQDWTSANRKQSPPSYEKSRKWTPGPTKGSDTLALEGARKLKAYYRGQRHSSATCTLKTAYKRKEWDSLKSYEKRDYIRAVKCLQTKPSISGEMVPGAKTRYDDFVAVHLNQTLSIHSTGNFLSWHRYYVYAYEKALREECDYKGYQPYINWARLSNSVIDAPIFDGSDTSISNNGVFSADGTTIYLPAKNPLVELNPQGGGGCITSGPFANTTVNLGPVAPGGLNNTTPNPLKSGLGYNPRCVRRDLSLQSAQGANDANVTKLITNSETIAAFQNEMQGPFTYNISEYGVHTAGHYIVGGDPGGDFYISPGDPWFWLHHAQVDRVWWIWQNLGIPKRWEVIAGTVTFGNVPPSRNATLEDRIELGVLDGGKGMTIREAVNTMEGEFCYGYD